jgi:hypothetical protein
MTSELSILQIRLLMLMKAAGLISLIYSRIDGVAPELPSKSFGRVAFANDDSVNLCAVDSPSTALTVYELQQFDMLQWGQNFPLSSVPDEVLCADRCTMEPNCTAFVYRNDVQQCHLYYFTPTACSVQQFCSYYTVRRTIGWNITPVNLAIRFK